LVAFDLLYLDGYDPLPSCLPITQRHAAGEDLDCGVPEMDLHPVAVELDLMQPSIAEWDLVDRHRELWFDESRGRAL
jgi:hypothetical protein